MTTFAAAMVLELALERTYEDEDMPWCDEMTVCEAPGCREVSMRRGNWIAWNLRQDGGGWALVFERRHRLEGYRERARALATVTLNAPGEGERERLIEFGRRVVDYAGEAFEMLVDDWGA